MRIALLALIGAGCAPERPAEDPTGWYDPGTAENVNEPVSFTDVPYGLDGGLDDFAADFFPTDNDGFLFAEGDGFGEADCDQSETNDLPVEITGVVTLDPKFYFKTSGCERDDEKYYGSFFIEDDHQGFFVLSDSKIAHWGMGDTVTLRVRGVRTSFDLDMLYAWEVVEIDRAVRPIHYRVPETNLDADDRSKVRQVEGLVQGTPDTFGEFRIESDEGNTYTISIDSELNRRGFTVTPGERIRVTGPVLYAYSTYSIIVIREGQLERVSD